jgi:hypothetical protein
LQLEEKSVEQICLDLWGKENQIYQMIEEGSELVTTLCHQRRGRFNRDQVYEDDADCLAMLDQMDLVFGKARTGVINMVDPSWGVDKVTIAIISTAGALQAQLIFHVLAGCEQDDSIIDSLLSLRNQLNYLETVTDKDAIAKWKGLKHKRMLKRIELDGEQKNCYKS